MKEEEQEYIKGHYLIGSNKAHKCCGAHDKVFNCRMIGTFNVLMEENFISNFIPSIKTEKAAYWFVELEKNGQSYYGWAIRDYKSHQRGNILEILTKELLPCSLKEGDLNVRIIERWDEKKIKNWAKDQYWFQGFSFSPIKKADSKFLWNNINIIDWIGCSVLDIGCHYGYFSFKASEAGAKVIGFDIDKNSLEMAETIRENIIQQDVTFVRKDPKIDYDVILYLSVHHQIDKEYQMLARAIKKLKLRTKKHLFVELILPPMFPKNSKMTEEEIDKIVGGEILVTYNHKVRGVRRVYHVQTS